MMKKTRKLSSVAAISIVALVVYISVELISFAAYAIVAKGELFSFSGLNNTQKQIIGEVEAPIEELVHRIGQAIHPYQGFVHDPENTINKKGSDFPPVNEYGLIDYDIPVQKKSEDKLLVAVLGGSVAWWLSYEGQDALIEELRKHPPYQEKEIKIVRLALGAYKQPQQLMELTYMYALGADYDLVINLDGFNEVALPVNGLVWKQVNPAYPMNWDFIVGRIPKREARLAAGRISVYKRGRKKLARFFNRRPLRYSVTVSTVWFVFDKLLSQRISWAHAELEELTRTGEDLTYPSRGPAFTFADNTELYDSLGQMWQRSSEEINKLVKAHDSHYFHFLQPNQYVPDSKPINDEETKNDAISSEPYRTAVEAGYPVLREKGKELTNRGVRFYDLSFVFKGRSDTIYVDDCCHMNAHGSSIMGREIGKVIAASLAREDG